MKIEISDFVVSEILDSLKDEIIKSEMEGIVEDTHSYSHPGDIEYYDNLRIAAAYVYNHYADSKDQYEIIDTLWPE